jgi:hypothetical protein
MEKITHILHGRDIFLTKNMLMQKRDKIAKKNLPLLWKGNTPMKI